MSLRLAFLNAVMRATVKPVLAHAKNPAANKVLLERGARWFFRPPPYARFVDAQMTPEVRCRWISARAGSRPIAPGKAIFYIHGGGFIAGSPETHSAMLARIAWLTGVEVCAVAYRISPSDAFPAAIEDVRAGWEALLAKGYRAEDIILGGDSAGGNLALVLFADCLARGEHPAGLFALSPLTDFTFSSKTMTTNARRDPVLPVSRTADVAHWYLAGADPTDPRASPINADFPNPPPTLFQYAETEILSDDCARMAAKLRAAGGDVTEQVWPNAMHVFQIFDGYIPEARDALRGVADFVKLRLNIQ